MTRHQNPAAKALQIVTRCWRVSVRRWLLPTIASLVLTSPGAAQSLSVNYVYSGNHNTDFSAFRATLQVDEFSDGRGGANANLVAGEYEADDALADIVRDALLQGLEHGGAKLVASDGDVQIAGRIVSSTLETVERDGVESLQLTVRTNLQVRGGGRTLLDTTLFGRGVGPADAGIVAALHASLDRMVRELVNDDYFLIELQ